MGGRSSIFNGKELDRLDPHHSLLPASYSLPPHSPTPYSPLPTRHSLIPNP